MQVLAGRAAEVCASPEQWLYAEALTDVMQMVGRSLLVGRCVNTHTTCIPCALKTEPPFSKYIPFC